MARLLAEAGASLEQIMDRLGRTDDQFTKNVYPHVTQEMKKEASIKILNVSNMLALRNFFGCLVYNI